jgi:hypothetical protein
MINPLNLDNQFDEVLKKLLFKGTYYSQILLLKNEELKILYLFSFKRSKQCF